MSDKSLRIEWTCRPSLVSDGQKSCLKKWSYSLSGAWSQCTAKFEHEVGLLLSDLFQKQHTRPVYCIPYSLEFLSTYLFHSRFHFLFKLYLTFTLYKAQTYLSMHFETGTGSFGHFSSNHTSRIWRNIRCHCFYTAVNHKNTFSVSLIDLKVINVSRWRIQSAASQSITISIVELEQSSVYVMTYKEGYKINGLIHTLF